MVSSTLLKLLRRSQSQSAAKLVFARSHKPLLTQIQIPSLTESGHLQKAADSSRSIPIPSGFTHVYPTFSFGYLLNPISPPPLMLIPSEDTTTSDDSRTIRADSVKKKRKKKMNKHKLRKLRKRLRRKTKT